MKNKEQLNEVEVKTYEQLLECAFYYGKYDCETKRSGWSRESTKDLQSTLSTADRLVYLLGGSSFRNFIADNYDAFTSYMKGVATCMKYDEISKLPDDLNKIHRNEILDLHLNKNEQDFVINTIRKYQDAK